MLTSLRHLALEVKYLDRARSFYVDRLGLSPARETDAELEFDLGGTALTLRRPTAVPRGGLHTHYAFSTPKAAYDDWRDRLSDLDPEEHSFGSYRSLYVDDPDDHCVEIGGIDGGSADGELTGIFEVVLEVADLGRAEELYAALGFNPVDRGRERRRVRLRGPFGLAADGDGPPRPLDLELWEPQLGLADARGGVHVDLGFGTDDPAEAVDAVADRVCERERIDGGVRVRDPDGHYLTFVAP
ncbi:VOC family protein [Halegenticoccus soli]|uniref:VOC family protein n=1 Tax=Halegenticoccus soli TaxID=1985678 RepID=UPI000C6E1607|nr:VOC family protein [Halegenticoccus soli]